MVCSWRNFQKKSLQCTFVCQSMKIQTFFYFRPIFVYFDIMIFDFLHFVFFHVQYIQYFWKHYVERLHIFYGSHYLKREWGGWHYLFWDKDSNEKTKNVFGIFLRKFPKIIIYIWFQQLYFGSKRKYLWKNFYTIKKLLKSRAVEIFFLSSKVIWNSVL